MSVAKKHMLLAKAITVWSNSIQPEEHTKPPKQFLQERNQTELSDFPL